MFVKLERSSRDEAHGFSPEAEQRQSLAPDPVKRA